MEEGDGEVDGNYGAMSNWNCRDLIVPREPPPNRRGYCDAKDDGKEHHFTEAAVMLAMAMYLFRNGAKYVELHPDGEHAKRFEIVSWLESHGFVKSTSRGSTAYGGAYLKDDCTLIVDPSSGKFDVVSDLDGQKILVECKGGVVNSTHAGVSSKLRKGLCELVGQLMSKPLSDARQIAVIPHAKETAKLAAQMWERVNAAKVELALVTSSGVVEFVTGNKQGR